MQQAYESQIAERAPGEEGHSSILRTARTLVAVATPAPSASVQPETNHGE